MPVSRGGAARKIGGLRPAIEVIGRTAPILRSLCDFRVTLCSKSAIKPPCGFTTIVSAVTSRPFRTGL